MDDTHDPDPTAPESSAEVGTEAPPHRIAIVQQMQTADCAAACLTMVLRAWGRHESLMSVRERLGRGTGGVSSLQILRAGESFGLRGRVIRMELDDLDGLAPGAILHWDMNHFVVLEKVGRTSMNIVDPGWGRRRVDRDEVNRRFTGVAILFRPTEAFEVRSPGRPRIHDYLRKILAHSRSLGQVVLLAFLLQGAALALPLLTGMLVDIVIPDQNIDLLRIILIGIAFVGLFAFVSTVIRSLLLLHIRTRLDLTLTTDFAEHLMRLPFSFFQARQTGDLMMRLGSNAVIRGALTSALLSGALDGLMVTTYLLLLFFVHWGFGLAVLGLGALRAAIFLATRRRYQELMTESLRAQADSSSYQVQMLGGIEVLKSFGIEKNALDRWSRLFIDVMNLSIRQGRLEAIVEAALAAVGLWSPLLLLGYGAWLTLQGHLSLGTMLALSSLAAGFLGPLSNLVSIGLQLQTLSSYLDRVEDVLAEDPERHEPVSVAPRLSGEIRLQAASYRHTPSSPWVLRDVSARVPAGGRVAIVGRSGSGKSTMARLIVQLYVPTSGALYFDDLDATTMDLTSVRRQIGYVPQSMFLFSGSVRENIALTRPDATLDEVELAARRAEIHEDILAMPLGYDTPLSEGDGAVAGGQRQRLALARALIANPRILILDEATSHLDVATESRILGNLAELDLTLIMIAHRLSSIRNADLILVLDHGALVESGTHGQLMTREGHYYRLVQPQLHEQIA